jgi:hypothetical protein
LVFTVFTIIAMSRAKSRAGLRRASVLDVERPC